MKRLTLTGFLLAIATFIPACSSTPASSKKFSMGGVPRWIADGARLEAEPEPYKPDPAIMVHPDESGPVTFELITDKRQYEAPEVKKPESTRKSDPIERGRDYRIKRLFR